MLEPKFNGPEHKENVARTIAKIMNALPGYSEDYLKGLCLMINTAYHVELRPYMYLADWEYEKMKREDFVPILKDSDKNVVYIKWPSYEPPQVIIEQE